MVISKWCVTASVFYLFISKICKSTTEKVTKNVCIYLNESSKLWMELMSRNNDSNGFSFSIYSKYNDADHHNVLDKDDELFMSTMQDLIVNSMKRNYPQYLKEIQLFDNKVKSNSPNQINISVSNDLMKNSSCSRAHLRVQYFFP